MGAAGHERWTIANTLPVLFVLLVIGSIWYIYVFIHLASLLQLGEAKVDPAAQLRGKVELGISQTITLFLLICFVRSILTDPGSVPDSPEWVYDPDHSDGERPELDSENEKTSLLPPSLESKQSGERRNCKHCMKYKPDRCHHCRVCKTCVLRMDHHCPWIANCVGFCNHKYFFLLVTYSVLDTHFITFTMAESLYRSLNEETEFHVRFKLVFGTTLAVMMGFLVTCFLGFHIWMALRSMTTIEFCEKQWGYRDGTKAPHLKFRSSLYDMGVIRNLKGVLGPRIWLWWAPFDPPVGDGLSYEISLEAQRVLFGSEHSSKRTQYRKQLKAGRRRDRGESSPSSTDSDKEKPSSKEDRRLPEGGADPTPEWTGPESNEKGGGV